MAFGHFGLQDQGFLELMLLIHINNQDQYRTGHTSIFRSSIASLCLNKSTTAACRRGVNAYIGGVERGLTSVDASVGTPFLT
jgi:hypothetical protein